MLTLSNAMVSIIRTLPLKTFPNKPTWFPMSTSYIILLLSIETSFRHTKRLFHVLTSEIPTVSLANTNTEERKCYIDDLINKTKLDLRPQITNQDKNKQTRKKVTKAVGQWGPLRSPTPHPTPPYKPMFLCIIRRVLNTKQNVSWVLWSFVFAILRPY